MTVLIEYERLSAFALPYYGSRRRRPHISHQPCYGSSPAPRLSLCFDTGRLSPVWSLPVVNLSVDRCDGFSMVLLCTLPHRHALRGRLSLVLRHQKFIAQFTRLLYRADPVSDNSVAFPEYPHEISMTAKSHTLQALFSRIR